MPNDRLTGTINFGTGQRDLQTFSVRLYRTLHGAAMVTVWGVLTLTGAIVARYCRHKPWWLRVHQVRRFTHRLDHGLRYYF